MSKQKLEELAALLANRDERATTGPWVTTPRGETVLLGSGYDILAEFRGPKAQENADFTRYARDGAPLLIEELRRIRKQVGLMKAVAEEILKTDPDSPFARSILNLAQHALSEDKAQNTP